MGGMTSLPALDGPALERFLTVARRCAPADVVEAAAARVTVERPLLLGFSGWPAAGKDTIPVLLYEELGVTPEHVYFAVPLKDEGDEILAHCRAAGSLDGAVSSIADAMSVTAAQAHLVTEVIYAAAQDPAIHARTRTDEVRRMLHIWGTDIRRDQDSEYWVRRALAPAVEVIAAGKACYLSDVRFANEVEWAQALGFYVVRLDVSEATVRSRLAARDGLEYTDEQFERLMTHPAEASLNSFPTFDLRFLNEESPAAAVLALRRALNF